MTAQITRMGWSSIFLWHQSEDKGRATKDRWNSKSSEKTRIQFKGDLERISPHEFTEIWGAAFDFSNFRMGTQTNLWDMREENVQLTYRSHMEHTGVVQLSTASL
jgi:hypothetical protein